MTSNPLASLPQSVQDVLSPLLADTEVKMEGSSFRLSKKGLVMDLDDLGEGDNGDYDPEDVDDTPLLRFSFYRKAGENDPDEELMEIHDSSYCTLIDARLDLETRLACAAVIFSNVYDAVGPYPGERAAGAKRECESMSHMCAEQLGALGEALKAAKNQTSLSQTLPDASMARKPGARM